VKSVNTFHYYFHSCNKISFVAAKRTATPLAANEIQALSVYEFTPLLAITLSVRWPFLISAAAISFDRQAKSATEIQRRTARRLPSRPN